MQDAEAGLMGRPYDTHNDTPERIAMCLNCQRRECIGVCDDIRGKRRAEEHRGRTARLYPMGAEKLSIKAWAARFGVKYEALRWHIRKGRTIEEAYAIMMTAKGAGNHA